MPKSVPPSNQLNKPAKPQLEFPLFAQRSGPWGQKIRGRFHYFGKRGDR